MSVISEEELFNQIFVENAWDTYHELQNRTFKPNYEDWLKVIEYFEIYDITIDSSVLTPQKSSAISDYLLPSGSTLEMPTAGTMLFSLLAQRPDNYQKLYSRVEALFSTAYNIHTTSMSSRPNIRAFESGFDVHPGNKLTTAHQILARPVQAIEWSPVGMRRHFVSEYIERNRLGSLTEIAQRFDGFTRAFIQSQPYRVHMFSDYPEWETDINGYKSPDVFDLSEFAKHTLKYPGIIVEFPGLDENPIYGTIVTNSTVIKRMFDEYTLGIRL